MNNTWIIDELYGNAIFLGNLPIVAMLNLFVRENNIIIDKTEILRSIYSGDCAQIFMRTRNDRCISFQKYNAEIEEKYMNRYFHMFVKKQQHVK